MNEKKAREILGKLITPCYDNLLIHNEIWWRGDPTIHLNGEYTADTIEAIAWWIKNENAKDNHKHMEGLWKKIKRILR